MKMLSVSGLVLGILLLVGCATNQSPMANSSETVLVTVSSVRSGREYGVEARMVAVRSSEPLPSCAAISTNVIDLLGGCGHADILAAPHITVAAGQWGEIRVCSTNTPGLFSVTTRMGKEMVSVSHPAGLLLRAKVEPITERTVRVQALVSVASEDARGSVYYQHAVPVLADCELGVPTVVFRKEHAVPSQKTSVMLTDEWKYIQDTTQ